MLDNILEKEILPKGKEDETIPTRVAELDTHIKFLNDQIAAINNQLTLVTKDRELLLLRSKEVRVFEDSNYKLVDVPVYPKKRVDVEALKRLLPDKHAMIVQNLETVAREKLQTQMEKIQVSISQADVKAFVKDKGMLAQIIPEPTAPIGWIVSVVKK